MSTLKAHEGLVTHDRRGQMKLPWGGPGKMRENGVCKGFGKLEFQIPVRNCWT